MEAAKEKQDYYQRIIEDVAKDRDYYKGERDEIRERMDKMAHSFMDWRLEADNDRSEMKMQIAKLGRRWRQWSLLCVETLACKDRQRVVLADDGTVKDAKKKSTRQTGRY